MYHDLWVILSFSLVSGTLLFLSGRWPAMRFAIVALAWAFALGHLALLVINVSAVQWLGAPLTFQWLLAADIAWNGTSQLMVSSVMTTGQVIGLALALLSPVGLLFLARRRPLARWWSGPGPAALMGAGCAFVLLTSHPPLPDRWRDAVTNPVVEMVSSSMSDTVHGLLTGPTNGKTGEYAVQQAAPPSHPAAGLTRPDILVVVLESVRARTVREHLHELPTLRRLAETGTQYPNASASVSTSLRTMFSLLFSRYPHFGYRVEAMDVASGYPEPFLRTLRRSGYRSTFILGGDFAFQNSGAMLASTDTGPTADSTTIRCDARWDLSDRRFAANIYLPDACTYDTAERWFLATPGPRVAVVWPEATHFPYFVQGTGPLPAKGSPAAYLAAIKHSDLLLGRMLARMARAGIRPVVLVIGDHGEQFGEHGFQMHSQTIYQEEVNIPFILSGPGVPAGKRDDRLVNLIDIAPTLLQLAGVDRPAGWQGISTLGSRRRSRDYSFALVRQPQAGMRTGGVKYIHDMRTDRIVAYDLAADPGEQAPRHVDGAEAAQVRKAIATWAQYNAALYRYR